MTREELIEAICEAHLSDFEKKLLKARMKHRETLYHHGEMLDASGASTHEVDKALSHLSRKIHKAKSKWGTTTQRK